MNSLILSDTEIKKLKRLISQIKLKEIPVTSEYELLRIKDQKINLILYKTGRMVFSQNKETEEILNSILQMETVYDYILGSDETGKGEWYGPLVVVVTALRPEEIIKLRLYGVKDSKTIKQPKIMEIADKIMEMNLPYHAIVLRPPTYNKLYSDFEREGKSLNDLLAWAHTRAIQELLNKIEFNRAKVIIDRFDEKKTEYRLGRINQNKVRIVQKTKAESETPVAAASILAKYLFEKEIKQLNEKYDLNLKNSNPADISSEILHQVAKLHFKNINKVLSNTKKDF